MKNINTVNVKKYLDQIEHSITIYSKKKGIYGVFLQSFQELSQWSEKLSKKGINYISIDSEYLYEKETFSFLKNLSELKKKHLFVDAMNYPREIIDVGKLQAYKDKYNDKREDWKIIKERQEVITDLEAYKRKEAFIMQFYTLGQTNIHDTLIDIQRALELYGLTNQQKLMFSNLIAFASKYHKAEEKDVLKLYLEQYEKQALIHLDKNAHFLYLFCPNGLIPIHMDQLIIPSLVINESHINQYSIDYDLIDDMRIEKFVRTNELSFDTLTLIINQEQFSKSLETKLKATKKDVGIFHGENAKEILKGNELYQELIKNGVFKETHQTWINVIYENYCNQKKYPYLSHEILLLFENIFRLLDAFHFQRPTFETLLGSIRVFLRFVVKIVLDTILDESEISINYYLKGHTSHQNNQKYKSTTDSFSRVGLVDKLKTKKMIKSNFSHKDFLNLSQLNNFLDSAAHRGDRNPYQIETGARKKFKSMTYDERRGMLLSVFKFLYSLKLDSKLLNKVENNLKKYYIF